MSKGRLALKNKSGTVSAVIVVTGAAIQIRPWEDFLKEKFYLF